MEMKGDKKRNGHNCGLYCPCGKMSIGHFLVKLFLAIAIIGLVTVIAMEVFYNLGKDRWSDHPCFKMMTGQVMQGRFVSDKGAGVVMMGSGGSNMFYKATKEAPAMPERVFGNITKIEANQITIKNNGAQEQVIISEADTAIISSSTEVGLAALKVGQDIIVIGSPDKDKKLVAKFIEIK